MTWRKMKLVRTSGDLGGGEVLMLGRKVGEVHSGEMAHEDYLRSFSCCNTSS